ncbi:D-amino-acid oxidase-like isoform X2 [Mizuhopecten yessoensis]|uniref:D-amino-acid oxidase-like isoform X2 n=1 Tax=Mizuhopecten yessoensis TaxID=6573 RepID=UPI000B45A304|nr:D-amino-acid oxidase-like isoform X2 [Mizuhopecten yessoensis]
MKYSIHIQLGDKHTQLAVHWTVNTQQQTASIPRMPRRVCVLGAGVIGLSSAVCIQELVPDADVTVVADTFTPHTLSDNCAGFWMPYLIDPSNTNVLRWCGDTFEYLKRLGHSELAGDIGIQFVSGYYFVRESAYTGKEPPWKDQVIGFRQLTPEELNICPNARDGYFFTTIIMDVKRFLPWLTKRILDKGGKLRNKKIQNMDELTEEYDIVVNCSGMGANQLCNDSRLHPLRGQVIKVAAPWVKHFYMNPDPTDDHKEVYILPGPDTVTIGGTGQFDDWNTSVDGQDKQRIVEDVCKLVPSLRTAKRLQDWVGLRPLRSPVRLEAEEKLSKSGRKTVIHNYGHSGSGVTFHWGCAKDTAHLVKQAFETHQVTSRL